MRVSAVVPMVVLMGGCHVAIGLDEFVAGDAPNVSTSAVGGSPGTGGRGGAGPPSVGGHSEGGGGTNAGGAGGAEPICGNGMREGVEECDDGNFVDGDGCENCVVVCPAGWTQFTNTHCYATFDNNLDWAASVAFCDGLGPGFHLATLVDFTEFDFVSTLTANNADYWIGGHDMTTEGSFEWVTGETWQWQNATTPWSGNNPNNSGGNEHCVKFVGVSNTINDNSCSNDHLQLCEYTPPG